MTAPRSPGHDLSSPGQAARPRVTLLRREFLVKLPIERAWKHLARVEQWPRWARHIQRVEV